MDLPGQRGLITGKQLEELNNQEKLEGPDVDAIKMFVGQVPRSMDEVC